MTRRHRFPNLLLASAFTPYLGVSLDVRWEHIVVYGALASVIASGRLASSQALSFTRGLLLPWGVLAGLVIVSTGLRMTNTFGQLAVTELAAILDNFLLPVAIMLVAAAFASTDPVIWRAQVRSAAQVVVTIVCANSLLILVFPLEQVEGFVRQFWANPASVGPRGTVADRALTGGRYGGIINQPLEGGLLYSLALMCWAYIFVIARRRSWQNWILSTLSIALVVAGGLSTGSKVFVFGSVIVVALAVLSPARTNPARMVRLVQLGGVASFGIVVVAATELATFDRFFRTLSAVGSSATIVSGGRWSSLTDYANQLLNALSVAGTGWGGRQDDALLAYLQGGGILGVIAFALVVRALIGLSLRPKSFRDEVFLMSGATFVVLASSFAAISLQLNRASSVYWVLVGLSAGHQARRRARFDQGAVPSSIISRQFRSGNPHPAVRTG